MTQQALFTGLIYDERDLLVDTAFIGSEAHYVVDDNGFATYHVVDGKQRLQTILSFFNNKISRFLCLFIQSLKPGFHFNIRNSNEGSVDKYHF